VWSLAFDPRGRTLASGSADTSVLLWDAASLPAAASAELTAKELTALWTDLGGEPAKAVRAALRLAAGARQAVPFLAEHLKPGPAPDEKLLTKLVGDLGSDDAETVRKASKELKQMGRPAEPALRKALEKGTDPDVRLRIGLLLSGLGDVAETPERLRALRAVQALEAAGTPAALALLAKLAEGTDLAADARAAHERLRRRGGSE
jgi:hypothetical protein